MRRYRFLGRLSPAIVRLLAEDIGTPQVWTPAAARKPTTCKRCGTALAKGVRTWRPITFQNNRMDRLDDHCILALEAEAQKP